MARGGVLESHLIAGREALAVGDWAAARRAFEAALSVRETAEALDGLGIAAGWLDDGETVLAARERGYQMHREAGDVRRAAGAAVALAIAHHDFRGDLAVARGWLARARRLVAGVGPTPELAWAAGFEAHIALLRENDPARCIELAQEAEALGRTTGELDAEMLGLALHGLGLVASGQVAEGMAMLDEASAAASSGELQNLDAACGVLCYVITACDRVRDIDRAGQWCEQMIAYAGRVGYRSLIASCRAQYAGVQLSRGAWEEAESELLTATEALRETRPAMGGEGLVRLAELRRRQGRRPEAEGLLDEAERAPFRSQAYPHLLLVRGEIALDAGAAVEAADLAERYVRMLEPQDRTARAAGLELAIRAWAEAGQVASAKAHLDELVATARLLATPSLLASAKYCEGLAFAAGGDAGAARQLLEDAVDLFDRAGTPFEAALARSALVPALRDAGRPERARAEAEAALRAFRELGARDEAARTARLLGDTTAGPDDPAGLSLREREVLALLARGKSNQEIAEGLFLSIRTVERHVTNIYSKLGASGKVARVWATDYAHRHGLA